MCPRSQNVSRIQNFVRAARAMSRMSCAPRASRGSLIDDDLASQTASLLHTSSHTSHPLPTHTSSKTTYMLLPLASSDQLM